MILNPFPTNHDGTRRVWALIQTLPKNEINGQSGGCYVRVFRTTSRFSFKIIEILCRALLAGRPVSSPRRLVCWWHGMAWRWQERWCPYTMPQRRNKWTMQINFFGKVLLLFHLLLQEPGDGGEQHYSKIKSNQMNNNTSKTIVTR